MGLSFCSFCSADAAGEGKTETALSASWLGMPMRTRGRTVGTICVQAHRLHAYGKEEQLLLPAIADQVAVENVRLFKRLYPSFPTRGAATEMQLSQPNPKPMPTDPCLQGQLFVLHSQ